MAAGPRKRVHRTRPTGQLARRPKGMEPERTPSSIEFWQEIADRWLAWLQAVLILWEQGSAVPGEPGCSDGIVVVGGDQLVNSS